MNAGNKQSAIFVPGVPIPEMINDQDWAEMARAPAATRSEKYTYLLNTLEWNSV